MPTSTPRTQSSLTPSQERLMNAFTSNILGIKTMPDGSVRREGPNHLTQGIQGYKGPLSLSPDYISPEATADYMTQSVLTPALRNFDMYIKPRIAESFAGGALSSRYGSAVAQGLGDIQSQFMGSLGQAQLANQQTRTQLAQGQIQSKYNEFLRTSPQNNPYLQLALGGTGQSQMYGYNAPTTFGNVLNTGLGLAGIGSSLTMGGSNSILSRLF